MAQEIEIEFKNILTKNEYESLLEAYPFPHDPVEQTNHYFETDDLRLKNAGCALRIRNKQSGYILTLKEPHGEGLLETHDELTKEEAQSWLNGQPVGKAHVERQLERLNIKISDLRYFGSLMTLRRELELEKSVLVLDYSTYNGQEDYEVELEAEEYEEGKKMFQAILEQEEIPKRRTPNKIERFFSHLKNLDGRH
jgi:uncharacterized protein YjbK